MKRLMMNIPKVVPPKALQPNKRGPKEVEYNPEVHPGQAYIVCCEIGSDYKVIADLFGIAVGKLREWRKTYEELEAAIVTGREECMNDKAEKSLIKRAMGYEYLEKKYVRTFVPDKVQPKGDKGVSPSKQYKLFRNKVVYGKYKMILAETYKKHAKPDVNALTLWLTNRARDRWKGIGKTLKVSGSIKSEKTLRIIAEKRIEQLQTLEIKELELLKDILSRAEAGVLTIGQEPNQ